MGFLFIGWYAGIKVIFLRCHNKNVKKGLQNMPVSRQRAPLNKLILLNP